ncbi:uncharacterized protein LOC119107016 [Pollicipes pollicipes]|uniref:uncharacterized protein LOC119107016 n=1 Tax=Pollicipes pollicipes TaxID=41117 RepID=UPI001885401E|nr:uncharacterized protein LOC119107016 [Pollicipes pollicipes]
MMADSPKACGRRAALLMLAVTLSRQVTAHPQGHRLIKDEEHGYSRQYMYGRRDHGAMHADASSPWKHDAGVKHGFYGMYDHYRIGRVHPLEQNDSSPAATAVKVHHWPTSAATTKLSANQQPSNWVLDCQNR